MDRTIEELIKAFCRLGIKYIVSRLGLSEVLV